MLVVLFAVLLPITFTITWAHYTVLNTTGWVNTVRPLSTEPAVANAVGTTVTNQLFTSLDVQSQIASALPSPSSFLAGPISIGIRGYIQDIVSRVIQSPQFNAIWVSANRFAHTQLVNLLEGKTNSLSTTDGQVVLNVVPLVNAVLVNMRTFASGIAGREVTLPTISADQPPAEACRLLGTAIGRALPDNCGQIPLFPADKLTDARRFVRLFNAAFVVLLVLTPVMAAIALWVSHRRRRTLFQLSVAGILGLAVFRRVVSWLQNTLVHTGTIGDRAARQVILSRVFHLYFSLSAWIIVALAAVVLVVAVTGPYWWAQSARTMAVRFGRNTLAVAGATVGRGRGGATPAWMRSHVDLLRVAGVVVAIILLLVLPVSWLGSLVIIAVLAVYELWVQRLKSGATTVRRSSSAVPGTDDGAGGTQT